MFNVSSVMYIFMTHLKIIKRKEKSFKRTLEIEMTFSSCNSSSMKCSMNLKEQSNKSLIRISNLRNIEQKKVLMMIRLLSSILFSCRVWWTNKCLKEMWWIKILGSVFRPQRKRQKKRTRNKNMKVIFKSIRIEKSETKKSLTMFKNGSTRSKWQTQSKTLLATKISSWHTTFSNCSRSPSTTGKRIFEWNLCLLYVFIIYDR